MKNLNNKKMGISLIVLIITIAVIIILATIVIVSAVNMNTINSAKNATIKHNDSVLKESASILSAKWETDRLLDKTTKSRTDYVNDGLKDEGFDSTDRDRVHVDEETGKVTLDNEIVGSAPEVAREANWYYGDYVDNYTESSASGVKWKILYSDKKNIFLIADDYIPYSSIPYSTKNGSVTSHKPTQGSNNYKVNFSSEITDYSGSESIIDTRLQNLNYILFESLKENNQRLQTSSMCATAYMMDKDAWKNFKGTNADFAIGGPTVELVIKSWNEKYSKNEPYTLYSSSASSSDKGYTFGKDSTGRTSFTGYIGRTDDGKYDPLYFIENTEKAEGTWLASPNAYRDAINEGIDFSGSYLNALTNDGNIRYAGFNSRAYNYSEEGKYGFRPVVCLKTEVELEEVSQDHFAIK